MASKGEGPVYFWNPDDPAPTGWLSQWHVDRFSAPSLSHDPGSEELVFNTAEQYMMYGKAMVFGDAEVAAQVMQTSDPKAQKALGRKVRGFSSEEWDKHRERVVEEGNWWKFTNGEDRTLREKLLATGERELVEASKFDRIWGVGFSAKNADKNREKWGQNLLGKALERVRGRLRREAETRVGPGDDLRDNE